MLKINKTYLPKVGEIKSNCYVIDAQDKILGRVAAKAAHLLRGKHKPNFTPHMDMGDLVVIINADKIKVSGKKMTDKIYQRFTGYPSGQKLVPLGEMLKKAPTRAMELAVNRMIPKGPLGNKVRGRLRVYASDKHPHQAQNPVVVTI